MISRRSLLGSILGASAFAFLSARSIGAQDTERDRAIDPTLWGYLAQAPVSIASLDQAVPFSYGNAKLQMDTLGFALPFDQADEEAVDDWVAGSYSVMLPAPIGTNALRPEFEDLTGFQIGQVFSGAELGVPPDMATLLRGDLQSDVIKAAQKVNGYREVDVDGRLVMSLAEGAAIDLENPVQRMAMARLNNSAFLDDGTLVYTPTLELMRAMLNPGATLDQQPFVPQALAASDGPLIGGMLAGPGAFLPDIPVDLSKPVSQDEIAEYIETMRAQEAAPAVVTGILGVTPGFPLFSGSGGEMPVPADAPKSLGKLVLVYITPEDAATAAAQIEDRLTNGSSAINGRPWSELFLRQSVELVSEQNAVALTLEWPGEPRPFDLVFQRDLGFITGP